MAITLRIEKEMIWDIFLFVSRTNFQDQLQVAQLGPQSIRLNILRIPRLFHFSLKLSQYTKYWSLIAI